MSACTSTHQLQARGCASLLCLVTGGGDFYMAAEADAYVHGVDLSVNMVLIALERASAARNGFKVHL